MAHSAQVTIKATVLLEKGLWIGLFERTDEHGYAVARTIFGGEPSDAELYEFCLNYFGELKFTSPTDFKLIIKRKNPQRVQREVRREMERAKSGLPSTTHAQEVLRLDLEKSKKLRKVVSKAEKEERNHELQKLKQDKKKKKLRGH